MIEEDQPQRHAAEQIEPQIALGRAGAAGGAGAFAIGMTTSRVAIMSAAASAAARRPQITPQYACGPRWLLRQRPRIYSFFRGII